MSAQANLQLYDGQSSPVLKTFSARGASLDLARYIDVSSGLGIGLPTITLGNRTTQGTNGAYRVEGRVTVPILEALSGDAGGYVAVPKVAFNMFGKIEMVAPNRASSQNRKDLKAYVTNLMAHAVMASLFVDFDQPT